MKFQKIEDAISYLNRFQFHGFRLGLERIEAALRALGNPQEAYPCIHVAGTNGKGSVCAALSFILQEAGLKVGFYSSPHLVELNERFRIDFSPVPNEELKELIEETASLVETGLELSYFEFTTAMAFSCFKRNKVDMAVIETGLGGRLDATNVITPVLSVITNIDLDHQSYLGDTLEEIAREKAGIIKKKVPVVTGETKKGPLGIIKKISCEKDSPLKFLGGDFFIRENPAGDTFDFVSQDLELKGLEFGLKGKFQKKNAALAVAACCELDRQGIKIDAQDMMRGLSRTFWPGRSELLKKGAWIYLDGAHNEAGLDGLRPSVVELSKRLPHIRKKMLLWACSNEGGDKDPGAMLLKIADLFDKVIITEPSGPRKPVTVKEWEGLRRPDSSLLVADYNEALDLILEEADRRSLVVVAGSLYLVGPARKRLIEMGFERDRAAWQQ